MPKSPEQPMANQGDHEQRPDFSEEDVEKMMKEFEEQDPLKQDAERKARAEGIEKLIEEGLAEAETAETEKQTKKEAGQKRLKLEASGAILSAAHHAASAAIESNLGQVLLLAESPEAVETMLVNSAIENARNALGVAEDFRKVHNDEKLKQLYANVDAGIRKEVIRSLKTELQSWYESAEEKTEKARLKKLLENIDKADHKAA